MSQTLFRVGRFAACAAWLLLGAATDSRAENPGIDIRIYDTGNATPVMRAAAIRTASAILAEAGVAAAWHDCTSDSRRSECRGARRSGNLIVRIMPTFVAGSATRGTALASRTSAEDADVRLGVAIVDPNTHAGEMATLYHEQVLSVAQRAGVDSSELLGRALAHEVGHLLLGVTGHSPRGLMRAVWTDDELTQNRRDDWLFAPADRMRLHGNP